jgi:adenylate cyclase
MAIEIERKFLVKKDIWEKTIKGHGHFYRQGYILTDPTKTIRIRLADDEGFITIKGLSVGASRTEYEYVIPKHDALDLLDNFCSSGISKLRYKIYVGSKLWEVDEFLDNNQGLVIAEIELTTEQETFETPDWLGEEVTEEEKYYNSNLSVNPYKNWRD